MEERTSRRSMLYTLGTASTLAVAGCLSGSDDGSGETVRVSGGVGPLPMMQVWADAYESETGVAIDVSGGGTGVGVSDVLNEQVDVAMMGREPEPEETDQGLFAVAMLMDTVVGTVSAENPVLDELQNQGLTRAEFEAVFARDITDWGELVDADVDEDIVVYGRSDASAAYKQWGDFLGGYTETELEELSDGNFDGDQAVAQAVGDDPNAISLNNINYVYDFDSGEIEGDVRPVPLDVTESGDITDEEDFYDTREEFLAAVEAGTYPAPPAREMFLASNGGFEGPAADFVEWILTEGQSYVRENGYVPLDDDRLAEQQSKLERGP